MYDLQVLQGELALRRNAKLTRYIRAGAIWLAAANSGAEVECADWRDL